MTRLPLPLTVALGLAAGTGLTHAQSAKPLFQSPVVKVDTPGQAVDIAVDLAGAKSLFLVATDAGDGFTADWADWVEPKLLGDFGEKKLTELALKSSQVSWGKLNINKNPEGGPLRVAGKEAGWGIGAHANSLIEFDLPPGTKRLVAKGGIDEGGAKQGPSSSIQFFVYTSKPAFALSGQGDGGGRAVRGSGGHSPRPAEEELASLEIAPGLEASVFASEPMLLSPSAIDIDARGRVWVAEIVNYRGHNGKRPEGDRILILEDTDGDGKADKQTVFYQGRDIDSPHGVCVLGNKVIVSAKGAMHLLTDTDGDDKADTHEILFSGIDGAQHDHGTHAVMFGPDGRLYFNIGNEGHQLRDKDGKPIIDADGSEIANKRHPYQQGMVFRCELDGSHVETLGWCFRNNWEVTVDSFGTIWQSDNDDDGNRGVRINYVMEFGNYGYADELTGAGWQSPRTNIETEIPLRHWHQNDPGVVPNLLQTGAGSPTGIMIYEGSLLPEIFRNQIIHCDAGPNIVRSYPVKKDGAGYSAEIVNILDGSKGDQWFRPSDVLGASDGSLMVADWYDPGVGGHGMGDLDHGRIFRIAPTGSKYAPPKIDVSTAAGAVAALRLPNNAARYLAFTALRESGTKAQPELVKLWNDPNPRLRARALWLLARLDARKWIATAIADADEDVRIAGLRLARELTPDVIPVVTTLSHDPSAAVRRECALALRHNQSSDTPKIWAELAAQHDGRDRWALEALGIGADKNWDACLDAWLSKVGGPEKALATPAGRDLIWRSRSQKSPALLARIVIDKSIPDAGKMRYLRALDFQAAEPREAALKQILAGW